MIKKYIILFALLCCLVSRADTAPNFKRTEDVVYGHKFGIALTMDVFQPAKPNGLGLIWVVSGGWFSAREMIPPNLSVLVDRGYTVFAVMHGSQPKFQITDAMQDMHRSVRFIRHNASKWNIDPNRLGVIGGSAGGHLSLVLGTQGGPGDPNAKDEVDRDSSAVQCVACFFPPTDFLNYGKPGEDAVGVGVLEAFKAAFGPDAFTADGRKRLARDISPINFVHAGQPPMMIIHGDADKLVPIQQAESFVKKSESVGATAKLVVKHGKGHGWADPTEDLNACLDWFDQHLKKTKAEAK